MLVRLFIGGARAKTMNEDSYTNLRLLDLSDFETAVWREIDFLCKEKRLPAFEVTKRSVSIRTKGRIQRSLTLASFSLLEAERLVKDVEKPRKEHPRAKMELVWELEMRRAVVKDNHPRT